MKCEFCNKDMCIQDYDFCDICPECLEDSGY
jgi:hypothetical protein